MSTRQKLMLIFSVFLLFVWAICLFSQIPDNLQAEIRKGEFSKAQQMMREELAKNLTIDPLQKQDMLFEIERLDRIKKDFTATREDVLEFIKEYVPQVKNNDLEIWEKEGALECWNIDGEKRYFKWAAQNLFRINKNLKNIKQEKDGSAKPSKYNRLVDVQNTIQQAEKSNSKFVNPKHFKVAYTLTVDPDAVPAGKVIRCWMPFPREIPDRQTGVNLLTCEPERHIIADNNDFLQRTIYFEKVATSGIATKFQVVFEFTNVAVFQKIDAKKVKPATITVELEPYVSERPPHIAFTNELRQLSKQIVGDEKNPYLIARKIFKYINDNIPWASAREYSTFYNISDYVYRNMHCDCGMHSIFFTTMCRMNGIPARWQSGWTTKPGGGGMHDWGEIYFAPYGWLPVDPDIGLVDSENETEKWFFLGGMDAYRLIVNDDFSQNLYPAKIHFRSETVDFQRGEVEWESGNLYFDQWDWDYQVEILD